MAATRAPVTAAQLWRPQPGEVLEGVVAAEFGRWPSVTEPLRSIVLELDSGERLHVLRAFWTSLAAELKRVRPLVGDHVRLERLPDDEDGRRVFGVERLDDSTQG